QYERAMKNPKQINTLSTEEAVNRAKEVGVIEQIAVLNVFKTLLHHPKLAKAVNDLLMTLLAGDNQLDARLRELLIMRIGWATGCDYEWTQHWKIALQFGLSEAEVLAVKDWQAATCLTEQDRAILAATDETLADGMISAATWETCAGFLDAAQLLELNVAIGAWRLISQLARSAGIELEEGVDSWPPAGEAPA
ncbi:MAG: carboxymuconolactone decarboxylase family protein, partial [bacterium]